jgi:catechol 2,3-dioxygenase-like lactoylglutathione lyase family enzyme
MIHHVTRQISRSALDDCVRFYGLLGFKRIPEPPGIAGRAVWLRSGATHIHLMLRDDAPVEAGHVGVIAPNFEAVVSSLRESGHEVEPRREHWGSPRAYVRDPAGNTVELMAWPPEGPGNARA